MSCDNTTLYVYVSTLSGTAADVATFSNLSGTLSGSVATDTHTATATNMTGIGAGTLSVATVPATAATVSGTIAGSLNSVSDSPAVVPTGTINGTFSLTQDYADLYNFTGTPGGSAASYSGDVISSTITLTGGTVNGFNYRAGETVTATITSGTLSSPSITGWPGTVADEYVEGLIGTNLFVDTSAFGTISRTASSDTLTVTLTTIGVAGDAAVENYPYSVHDFTSVTIVGGEMTSSISGKSTSQTVTGGTLSSGSLDFALTGSNVSNHVVYGELNTAIGTFPVSATLNKNLSTFTATSTLIDGTLNVPVSLYPLSSIPVNGGYGINPGYTYGGVSGRSLTETISTGVISSSNIFAILTSDTVTEHFISGTVDSYGSLYQTPVEGHITTSTDGTYTGVLTSMDGVLNTSINVYQLSSIPVTGSLSGSVSGESISVSLTSGTVSSNLTTSYILTSDSVTNLSVTGVGNNSTNITGTLTSTGSNVTMVIDTSDNQTIDVATYSLSSFSITGGALTDTVTNSAWTNNHSQSVSITGGSLSGTQTYMLTSEALTGSILPGTLNTNIGDLTASIEFNTIGNHLSGATINVETVSKDITITPISSYKDEYFIRTTTISSSEALGETLSASISTAETLAASTISGYVDVPLSITGTLATDSTSLTSLLSGNSLSGNFYTLYGGGMQIGAGTEHSMTTIPITAGTLTGVSDCMSITRELTAGVLSSTTVTTTPLSATLTAHNVNGYGITNKGETVSLAGFINKAVSGNQLWTATLTSVNGSSTISEPAYRLDPVNTTTGTVTGTLSSVYFSSAITSSLLSSTTLTHLLTCQSALSSHSITGTITTGIGTVNATGTIDTTTSGTYTGNISAQNYPVSFASYSLSSIPVTGAMGSTSALSSITNLAGTLSSTTLSYILTSSVVTSHGVAGLLSNATFDPFLVTGVITTTTSGTYTFTSLTAEPVSSYTLTASVVSSFPRKELTVGRGHTYTFILTTPWPGVSHPFKFSTTPDGEWSGGDEYTTDIIGAGGDTPGDEIKLQVNVSTPTTLYYYDSQTADAGGIINVSKACSLRSDDTDEGLTDTDTTAITERQKSAAGAPAVQFLFNNKKLDNLELYNDTKYTFFVNNSSDSVFSFNNQSGEDASLGSPRQVSNNRSQTGAISFARMSNQTQLTVGNQGESNPGGDAFFYGTIPGGCGVETSSPPPPSETGYTEPTNITDPPGATDPDYYSPTVDCDAPELYRTLPPNTVLRMPQYSRTVTTIYYHEKSRRWEYPTWTYWGHLTAVRAGSSVTFTSVIPDTDPITITASGSISADTLDYTWTGNDAASQTLTGNGSLIYGINSYGGETGAVHGNWYMNVNGFPVVSGEETWSVQVPASAETTLSATIAVSPSPGEYKSRYDWLLHNQFTTEYEPAVISHGIEYRHPAWFQIGPYDNDITLFTSSEVWTNGGLYIDINGIRKTIEPTSSDSAGNIIEKETIISVIKAGQTATVNLSGTDGQNLWAMGIMSYIETVCLNNFSIDAVNVQEVDSAGDTTINSNTVLNPAITNNLSAISAGDLDLTVTHIPAEIPDVKYRWFKDDYVIPGAVAATLNFLNTSSTDDGDYYCAIETPYRYKTTKNIAIVAHTFTAALAGAPVLYTAVTTFAIAAGDGDLWTTPRMNVQVWRCLTVGDNTLSAVQEVVNEDVAITPFNSPTGDTRTVEATSMPTPLFGGGQTMNGEGGIDAISADPLNWRFAHSNTEGQHISSISALTGVMEDRYVDVLPTQSATYAPASFNSLYNGNDPWNYQSDFPVISGSDSVYVVMISTPLTGAHPMFVTMDGGTADITEDGLSATQYTHFISQTGWGHGPSLTATDLSSLRFTVDALTGAPYGRTFDHVFANEPWSHHLSAWNVGLSGDNSEDTPTKVLGVSGAFPSGSFLSATFLSLSSMSSYTYLSGTSSYAVTGDVVHPDTTFHISTQPGLSGIFAIDVSSDTATDDSESIWFTLYELMPHGVAANNQWIVTRNVAEINTAFGVDAGEMNHDTQGGIFHPAVQSLTANTTSDIRYLLVAEWDIDHPTAGDGAISVSIDSIISRQYLPDGTLNDGADGSTDTPGFGLALPTFATSAMKIHGIPAVGNRGYTNFDASSTVFGLSASNLSLEGQTATVSAINTVGTVAVEASWDVTDMS